MKRGEAGFNYSRLGEVPFEYPPEPDSAADFQEALADQRKADCARMFESAAQLIFSSRTDRVAHMRASVAIAILKGDLDVGEIAGHFQVSWTRVEQIIQEMAKNETFGFPPDK